MLQNQMFSFLKSALSIVLIGGAFCCWILLCVWALNYQSGDSKNQSVLNDSAAVATVATTDSTPQLKITNELRYTAMGWQTPSHWVRQQTQDSQLSISHLNPILLALLILQASLLAILLYAPEEEIDSMLKSSNLKRKDCLLYTSDAADE